MYAFVSCPVDGLFVFGWRCQFVAITSFLRAYISPSSFIKRGTHHYVVALAIKTNDRIKVMTVDRVSASLARIIEQTQFECFQTGHTDTLIREETKELRFHWTDSIYVIIIRTNHNYTVGWQRTDGTHADIFEPDLKAQRCKNIYRFYLFS